MDDLRPPLDSIVAYVDVLLEDDLSEHERRHFLEVIRSAAVRARTMAAGQEAAPVPADRHP